MTQTICKYQVSDLSGIEGLPLIDMEALIEDYADVGIAKSSFASEDRYESTQALQSTPWRVTLCATDYCREIGWYATQDQAANAAIQAAREDGGRVNEVEPW